MEDRDSCTTELYLKEDGVVLIGETDGPLWREATGVWMIDPGTDDFTMRVTRHFQGGHDGSDMGEFRYTIERTFVGDMTAVGESVAITGVMRALDALGGKELEVGFFNMIDGTDIRLDRREDARSGVGEEAEEEARRRRGRQMDASAEHRGWDAESQMTYHQKEQQMQMQRQQQQDLEYTYSQQQQQQQQPPADPYAAYYEQQRQLQQQQQAMQQQQQDSYSYQQEPYGQQQQDYYGQQDQAYDDYQPPQQQQPTQADPNQAYTYEEYYRQQQEQQQRGNDGPDGWPRY